MKKLALFGMATAMALTAAPAAHAATFIVNDPANPASGSFTTDPLSTAPDFSVVNATFKNSVSGTFDDLYKFILPLSGNGSGQLGVTFGKTTKMTITDVFVTTLLGVTHYTAADFVSVPNGISLQTGLIPIKGDLSFFDSIQVKGFTTGPNFIPYTGSISFEATPVPEASTWALMILGIGAVGFAARRSRKVTARVTYA